MFFFFFLFLFFCGLICSNGGKKQGRVVQSNKYTGKSACRGGLKGRKVEVHYMARVELLTFGVATGGALCLESAMGRSLVVSVVGS